MSFMYSIVFGVPIWLWLYFFLGLGVLIFAVFFVGDGIEKIRGTYYRIRFPQRLIRVLIHYPTNYYRVFWRLIPDNFIFKIKKKDYIYDPDLITAEDDLFIARQKNKPDMLLVINNILTQTKKGKEIFKIGNTTEYEVNKFFKIREKGKKYSELHYFYNVPQPIQFDYKHKSLDLSSSSLEQLKQNDLFVKLLRLKSEKMIFTLIMILMIVNTAVSMFIMAKMMGWLE